METFRHFEQQINSGPVPYFALPSGLGRRVAINEYRNRSNVILCFMDEVEPEEATRVLQSLAAQRPRYQREEAELLVVCAAPLEAVTELQQALAFPYPLLADPEGVTRQRLEALLPEKPPSGPLIFILDRYNAPFAALGNAPLDDPALQQEVLDWLALAEMQCPE